MSDPKIGTLAWTELEGRMQADIDAAVRHFDGYVKDELLTRYQLAQGSKDYYDAKFQRLSRQSTYVSYDVADAIDWIMPSLLELFFGGSKIVSMVGRTQDDDPYALEQLIQYQIMTQNSGFMIFHQWILDSLKAGCGVTKAMWCREEQKRRGWVTMPPRDFLALPDGAYRDARENPDGTFSALVEQNQVIRNQPILMNVMPGSWIFSPQREQSGRLRFEGSRMYQTRDQILRLAKQAGFRNLEKALGERGYGSEALDDILQQILEHDSDEISFRDNPTDDPSRDVFLPSEVIGR